jgi:DtxR family Mn-dependent transcriptional regulator
MNRTPQYLLAIYIAEHRREPPIPSGELAALLDRAPATVTETCQRLADDGLVVHEPYEGVTLTEAGRDRAARLHETYVTVSWFFRSVLDLDDHETEAMELAGLVSPAVARRLAATLPTDGADATPAGTEPTPDDEATDG